MKYLIIITMFILTGCVHKASTERLPFYNTPDFTPVWLSPDDAGYHSIHTIAPFSLMWRISFLPRAAVFALK
jgi:protein SCO1/2